MKEAEGGRTDVSKQTSVAREVSASCQGEGTGWQGAGPARQDDGVAADVIGAAGCTIPHPSGGRSGRARGGRTGVRDHRARGGSAGRMVGRYRPPQTCSQRPGVSESEASEMDTLLGEVSAVGLPPRRHPYKE